MVVRTGNPPEHERQETRSLWKQVPREDSGHWIEIHRWWRNVRNLQSRQKCNIFLSLPDAHTSIKQEPTRFRKPTGDFQEKTWTEALGRRTELTISTPQSWSSRRWWPRLAKQLPKSFETSRYFVWYNSAPTYVSWESRTKISA